MQTGPESGLSTGHTFNTYASFSLRRIDIPNSPLDSRQAYPSQWYVCPGEELQNVEVTPRTNASLYPYGDVLPFQRNGAMQVPASGNTGDATWDYQRGQGSSLNPWHNE